MPWNEPGGGRDQDPWGGNPRGDQGPPDIDELLRKLQRRFGGLMGRGGGSGGDGKGFGLGFGLIAAVAVVGWVILGFYTIQEGTQGVVMRFGRYVETTGSGLHWYMPLIERVERVNVLEVRDTKIGYTAAGRLESQVLHESRMLTQDENIVDVALTVQYRIKDAAAYLFNVRAAEETLREAAESAVREVVGKSKMDFVITDGREEIASASRALIQEIVDRYETGLEVISVNLQRTEAPTEVKDAFDDAIKAREDKDRYQKEAEAYANKVVPEARGKAKRLLEEAKAYKESVIARAEGETKRFEQLLAEYHKAPEVTRRRLYLDTMEEVLGNSGKVMVDVEGGNNLLYLPLDRLTGHSAPKEAPLPDVSSYKSNSQDAAPVESPREPRRLRDNLRLREVR